MTKITEPGEYYLFSLELIYELHFISKAVKQLLISLWDLGKIRQYEQQTIHTKIHYNIITVLQSIFQTSLWM